MKMLSPAGAVRLFAIFFLLLTAPAISQVGIGTTSPDSDAVLDVTSSDKGALLPRMNLTNTTSAAPLSAHVAGMLVYNQVTANDVFPGYYFNNGSKWIRAEDDAPVDSVTLGTNTTVTSAYPTYASITGMGDLTFTARKSSVFVMLTASGSGFSGSMALVTLRVRNVTSGTVVGGTVNKIQNFDFFTGTITTWSASFSKLLTGLTVGTTYTLRVEGAVSGIAGTFTAVLQPASLPDAEHLTLSVIH